MKVVLGTVLEKLELGNARAKIDESGVGEYQPHGKENLKDKIDQLGTTEQIWFISKKAFHDYSIFYCLIY